ncbi:hypothetical protein AB0C27_46840 [Nonomuraea sp. NPDC048882]|uniref:hypothetical protein n=1 Tax=Nonomuraea sp. NPDC048882 TaxID=3154347 RepID=UPI0033E0F2E3
MPSAPTRRPRALQGPDGGHRRAGGRQPAAHLLLLRRQAGLLDELRRRWREAQAELVPPGASFAESLGAQLDATLDQPDWARLVVWQALGDCPFTDAEEGGRDAERQREAMAASVDRTRRRRQDGEIRAGLDPAFALLAAYAIIFAPITMPQLVRDILGGDPLSPEPRRLLRTQLVALLTEDEERPTP